ncbi:MAG: ABC transporter ATP-binding protein/permease [Erysipelotrichaceae bacterium]|nr:ABC transporter ATP-binding protein/permease [Erysipelotrichaceae bacterium]
MSDHKLTDRNIPMMNRRSQRFAEVEQANDVGTTLKRLLAYFAKEKKMVLSMLIVVIVGTLAGVYAPSLQSQAVDIIAGSNEGILMTTLLLMAMTYAIYCVCQLLQGVIGARLSQSVVKKMRDELFSKIVDLPVSYLDNHSHGDVMSRMSNDIENISTVISQSLASLFSGVLTIIGTIIMMVYYCWQLALLSCLTIILTVVASNYLSKKVRKYSRQRQSLLGYLNGHVEEMITGYHSVVAYNRQDEIIDDFMTTSDDLTKAGIRCEIFSGVMGPVMNCISNIGFVIIAVFGGYFAIRGLISVGVISAFIVYAKQFSRPINELANIFGQLQTAIAGAERVFIVLDENNENMEGDCYHENNQVNIEFKHVNFSYKEDQPIIKNFSLYIPSGKKVALVGATGSGKTTIVNLLMRFYDIDSGDIYINDQNLNDISRDTLRHNMAIVLQDTTLFSDTIRNNLMYVNDKATQEDLDHAIEMSHCSQLLHLLPDGYETVLTGAGEHLSLGQRQLLAIARAFVADPKILILDEATSNVDTRTEKDIQDAMHIIMENRTSIIIAHRLSTIRDADMIVVMDQGEIVETGNHDELLAQKGKYYDLYMSQYAGYTI